MNHINRHGEAPTAAGAITRAQFFGVGRMETGTIKSRAQEHRDWIMSVRNPTEAGHDRLIGLLEDAEMQRCYEDTPNEHG
jgi:hypothetical protein